MRLGALIAIIILCAAPAFAEGSHVPRKLIALYDSDEAHERMSNLHRFLEMPANHLGFTIEFYDVHEPLPTLDEDVKGVAIWFSPGYSIPEPKPYLNWLSKAIEQKKKLVIIENAGIAGKHRHNDDIMQHYNSILSYIGMQDRDQWNAVTYPTEVLYIDNSIASFERTIGPVLPPYGSTYVIPGKAQSHLKMLPQNKGKEEAVDLIITSPNGGFVAEGYALFEVIEEEESILVQWFINPFVFLKNAFDLSLSPIPDVTTLYGKRIFYSHIDGDGWNNICEIPEYAKNKTLSSEVIYEEILKPYNDLPVTVGLVVSDAIRDCYGVKDSEEIARKIYALDNIEAASHTFSHPLFWSFFENYTVDKEAPVLNRYPPKPKAKASLIEDIRQATSKTPWTTSSIDHDSKTNYQVAKNMEKFRKNTKNEDKDDVSSSAYFNHKQYDTPRSYACNPYSLHQEIVGAIEHINKLTPPDKNARLVQWSGDTNPYEGALRMTREAGFLNINGGDSRFDTEYPSYSSVSPIGLKVGNERQIYSSNSNENTYTNLWTDRFFGFRYLQRTVENTETPIRVRPFNIYYHMYSGQKLASLRAVKENMDFARTQNIIPITTSHYAEIANNFYEVSIRKLDDMAWKIENAARLKTLRFDNAFLKSVDFNASEGVIGQNYFQGSLYVHLDYAREDAIIRLKNIDKSESPAAPEQPYLIESSWLIKDLQFVKSLLTIDAAGFGTGKMKWQMPQSGEYIVKVFSAETTPEKLYEKTLTTDNEGILKLMIELNTIKKAVKITIEPKP